MAASASKVGQWLRKIYLRQILVYKTFGIGPWSGNLPHYFWPLLKDLGFVVSFNLNKYMSTFYHFAESDVDGDTLLQISIDGSME